MQAQLTPDQQALYQRIQAHPLEQPDQLLPFCSKLAQQNGWSRDYATRVVQEYRRFVLLALCSGHVASPSDAVDQAWHQHLCDSRDYWERFCPQVLRQTLHHEPSRGGQQQDSHYRDLYQQTLASYQRLFGVAPPADIWPPQPAASRFVRLDTRQHWCLPKPTLTRPRNLLAGLASSGLLAGCAVLQDWRVWNYSGPDFLGFYLSALLALALFSLAWHGWCRWRDDSASAMLPPSLDAYQAAYLAGGPNRVLQTALLKLEQQQLIHTLPDGTLQRTGDIGLAETALERSVFGLLREGEKQPGLFQRALPYLRSQLHPLRQQLEEKRLLLSNAQYQAQVLPICFGMAALWLLGLIKIAVGISRDKPVAILIVIVLAYGGFCAWRLLRQRGRLHPTRLGRDTMQASRQLLQKQLNSSPQQPDLVLRQFAWLGSAALVGTAWGHLLPVYRPTPNTDASSASASTSTGCSSSDSSGSDGGGGGCGGCGGGGGD
ncbi:TIGR04222 domain-containing membrane protein [Chitinimonas sp. JJ19]|uniref:TIGR04222 domain-containing membrane protein n=1 Tax=Chitinimonas sp. JJ19 TaxID=3109352 RepID=UPI00300333CE